MSTPSRNVVVEVKDRIARIELSRVEKRNALTADMYLALADEFERAEADPGVRAVLLHGRPDCFCSGNDLKDFLERDPRAPEPPSIRFLHGIAGARKPIVAAVGGPAVGIGTTMLLHFDLVYAAPGTRFQLPFVSLGLVPEAASSLLLPMSAGYRRAAELMLLGQPFDAEKALAAGIVTAVVPEAELLEHARSAAAQLAALPPSSVRLTKELMKRAPAQAVAERMAEEHRLFGERLASPEAREAFTAFLEKRKPDFSRFG
jgi:enoyl-CoA hydratase/carnithine racemase